MSLSLLRILFLADTHLGFDLPFRPRVQRRRRGHDFFANFERALEPALKGEADLVVHGGDLFYRSKIPDVLVQMAMEPLVKVAGQGVPVYIVPGNHERSKIPLRLWTMHPNIHIFDQPKTYLFASGNTRLALSGFPFTGEIRDRFAESVRQTRYQETAADIRILCMHQTVEGAQVGPSDYTFRYGKDIIRGRDIPQDFCVVLSGHIHRSQTLTHDLRGDQLATPVVYPGSIERTSFAERHEDKHFIFIDAAPSSEPSGKLVEISFQLLQARPMRIIEVDAEMLEKEKLTVYLGEQVSSLDPNSVVRIKTQGEIPQDVRHVLNAAFLRCIAPPSMNISVAQSYRPTLGKEGSGRRKYL
jgi:DNA repair exonuclease SbcCD nuclease subunit